MPKFESAPKLNSPELNPNEIGTDVNTAKKLEGELTPEELEKLKVEEGQEQEVVKPELSPEEQLRNLEGEVEARQQEITRLNESVEGTEAKLNETRKIREAQLEKWRLLLHDLDNGKISADNIPVHTFLKHWVGYGGDNKEKLIEIIQRSPEAAETAKEIQDFAQNCLTEEQKTEEQKTLDSLYPSPKLRLFRGVKGEVLKDAAKIQPWDSLTTNKDFASTSANPYADWGWKQGTLLEIEIPVENIFTYWKAHPAFNPRQPEEEYILNEKGIDGAKVVSIDGRSPTPEEAVKIRDNMPGIEVVLEEKSP